LIVWSALNRRPAGAGNDRAQAWPAGHDRYHGAGPGAVAIGTAEVAALDRGGRSDDQPDDDHYRHPRPGGTQYARFRRIHSRSCYQSDSYDASIQFAEELRQLETAVAADAERFAGYARWASRD